MITKRLKNPNLFQNVDSAAFSFKVTVSDFGDLICAKRQQSGMIDMILFVSVHVSVLYSLQI